MHDKSDSSGSWWQRRTKLEKKLVISLISISTLLVGILFYYATRPGLPEICTTPGCLTAAAQIIKHIDPSTDPCEDFFQFSCGTFIKNQHGDMKANSVQELENLVARQIAEIIKEPISDDDHYFVRNHKILFQACMNETAIEEGSLGVFKETLEELNGWPVVVGFTWKSKRFDWKDMMYELRERGYPSSMILSVERVTDDPDDPSTRILQITAPRVKRLKDEHKELYKEYMSDIAVMFGAEKGLAEVEMEKVLDFMENLRKIIEKNRWSSRDADVPKLNHTEFLKSNKFTIDEFQTRDEEYNKHIDWLEFINNNLGEAGTLSGDDYVIFPRHEFLVDLFKLLQRTQRIQANYMIWSVIEEIMPFLSKEIKQREANYSCITEGSSGRDTSRYDFCRREISTTFSPRPADVLFARKYLPPSKREHVQELYNNVKSEFVSLLTENPWMDDETKAKSLEKAEVLQEIIGAPGDYFDDAVFESFPIYNESLEDIGNGTFFEMFLSHSKLQMDLMLSKLHEPTNTTDLNLYYYLTTRVNAMYNVEENKLVLPAGILQGIFYDEERPMYLNYGAIGSIIGHELTHGFCKDASSYDTDGTEIDIWTEKTKQNFEEASRCVIKDAEDFDVEYTESTINGTMTLEENIADYTGLRVSYAAYQTWVDNHGDEPVLPGIDYTPNQLFWISAISYECYKITAEKVDRSLKMDYHAHNEFRATAPMRNTIDFAVDFDCPVGSNMNPEEKCQVF